MLSKLLLNQDDRKWDKLRRKILSFLKAVFPDITFVLMLKFVAVALWANF